MQRKDEWDEFLVFGAVGGSRLRVAFTTDGDGSELRWAVLKMDVGFFRAAVPLLGGGRSAPAGVNGTSVN